MKGVGRIYQQTYVDTYSRVTHAKLYSTKTTITSADLLNDKVLPFVEENQLPVLRILKDRGIEYCGKADHHDYQLYLAVNNIDHTKTKVKAPQTNGTCELFHRTIWDAREADVYANSTALHSERTCIRALSNCKMI